MTPAGDEPTSEFDVAVARVEDGADPDDQAAALVASMTPDERLGCLDGDTPFWPGLVDMTSGGYYRHPWPAAVVERLGVPGIDFADGPRGCVIADATAFPVSMGRGATFDPVLEERVGEAIGLELRAAGATFTGAVCLNLLRHPAWGRAQETYGEDPHHVGEMAAALTRGLERNVLACMKHFALNSMENARFSVDVMADERALHEVYLPHFKRVAAEGIAATMSAYNSVNGSWCGENETLLTGILRNEWGWDGVVVSDFVFGLRDPVASVGAGLDIEMPFRQQRELALRGAIERGELDEAVVRRSAARVVSMLLRRRELLSRQPDESVISGDAHRALARIVSAAATVMVRNDALLPVDPATIGSIVVLGRLADRPNLGDGGSSDVRSTRVVTPLAGLRETFGEERVVDGGIDVDQARGADLVVVVVGFTKDDEGEYVDIAGTAALAASMFPPADHPELGLSAPSGEILGDSGERDVMAPGGDRDSLRLRPEDESLIAASVEVNPNVVVVVQCGSAVVMPWADSVGAVLITWYPGVEGGSALADVLVGRAEPGGRLPFAIPRDEHDLVPFEKNATEVTYGLLHGQWWLDAHDRPAHFPFGSGDGFTQFALGSAAVDGDGIVVEVTNTGARRGSTVVFAFGSLPGSTHLRPSARLIGFSRVALAPGEAIDVPIALDWSMLDLRRDGGWTTEQGRYAVRLGFAAGDTDGPTVTFDRGSSSGVGSAGR